MNIGRNLTELRSDATNGLYQNLNYPCLHRHSSQDPRNEPKKLCATLSAKY